MSAPSAPPSLFLFRRDESVRRSVRPFTAPAPPAAFLLVPSRLFNSSRSHRDVLLAAVASLPLANTLYRDVSETPPAGRRCSPRDETFSTAFPIFHAAAGGSEEDRYQSLTVHYNSSCQIERASVGCPPMDSTFLQRSMLICSLLLLFVPARSMHQERGLSQRIASRRTTRCHIARTCPIPDAAPS